MTADDTPDRLPSHVAVSGELGSGKSVVCRGLSERFGARVVSTGEVLRSIARDLGLSALETNRLAETQEDIDERVDAVTRELGAHRPYIIFDSRLAWHMVPTSFKVHLLVDPVVGSRRIHGRGATDVESYTSEQEAQEHAEARYQSERRRFIATYGVDTSRLRNYDLVVDTSDVGIEDVVETIADAIRSPAPTGGPAIWLHPSRLRIDPDLPDAATSRPDDAVPVLYSRPVFATSCRRCVQQAAERFDGLMPARLVAEGDDPVDDATVDEILRGRPDRGAGAS